MNVCANANPSDSISSKVDDDFMLDPKEWNNLSKIKVPMRNWKSVDNPSVIVHVQKAKLETFDMLENEALSIKRYADDLFSSNRQVAVCDMMGIFFGEDGVLYNFYKMRKVNGLEDYTMFR